MKHFYTLTLGALAMILAIAACKKEETPSGGNEPVMVTASWTASFEDYQSVTKASLMDDLSVEWEEGDAISVFSNRTNYQITASSVNGATASFSGEVAQAETYLALYPYNSEASSSGDNITAILPETQELVAGGADPEAMLAVARTQTGEMQFQNMVALVGIRCSEDVTSLAITAPGEDDRIAGRVRFNTGTGRATAISGSNRIDLDGDPEANQTYYAAVIPGEISGLVVVAMNAEGKTAEITVEENAVTYESNTATVYEVEFEEDDWILRPPTGQSYVLEGAEEVNTFCELLPTPKEEVVDITISGTDVTDEILAKISARVGAVSGNVVWDNVGATATAGFFDAITCNGGITLSNCASLEGLSGFDAYMAVGGDLVIENCASLGQGFAALESVGGSFRLENTTARIGEGASFAALKTIGGDFSIIDCGETVTSFKGATLQTVEGSINITGNASLTSLAGLDALTRVGGDVIITDNGNIPTITDETNVGYCIIQEYRNMSIVSSTANVRLGASDNTIDLSTLPTCDGTLPGEAQSYTITSQAQLEAFLSAGVTKETVNNLTITGSDITADAINRLAERVYAVEGTLTLEDLTLVTDGESFSTEAFLPGMVHNYIFDGSIVIRNVTGSINPNGFRVIHEIKGDLIIENCPQFRTDGGYAGLALIEKIGGDFRFVDSGAFFDGYAFENLNHIGGDFFLEGLGFFFLRGMGNMDYIGGDLVIKDNPSFWGLNGFENLTYLGGDVTIVNYGKLQIKSGVVDGADCVGLCVLRDLQNNNVIRQDAVITISNNDEVVDYDTILSCSATYEGDKSGDGEKFDDPETVGGWN